MTIQDPFVVVETRLLALITSELRTRGIEIIDIRRTPEGSSIVTALGELWTGNLALSSLGERWEVLAAVATETVEELLMASRAFSHAPGSHVAGSHVAGAEALGGPSPGPLIDLDDPLVSNQLRLCLRRYPYVPTHPGSGSEPTYDYAEVIGQATELLALRLNGSTAILPDLVIGDRYEELRDIARMNMADVPFELDFITKEDDTGPGIFLLSADHGLVSSLARTVGDTLAARVGIEELAKLDYVVFAPADACLVAVPADQMRDEESWRSVSEVVRIYTGRGGLHQPLLSGNGHLEKWSRPSQAA